MRNCWIDVWTVEEFENVRQDQTIEFAKLFNMFGERDDCWNVKRDQTIEFVTLFNMWDCWMRLDRGIRKE